MGAARKETEGEESEGVAGVGGLCVGMVGCKVMREASTHALTDASPSPPTPLSLPGSTTPTTPSARSAQLRMTPPGRGGRLPRLQVGWGLCEAGEGGVAGELG